MTLHQIVAVVGLLAWLVASPVSARQDRASLCGVPDRSPGDLRRQLEPLGEGARIALVALAESPERDEVRCGVAGLSALRDPRVIPYLVAALRNPAFRDDAYQLARAAAFMAGGPEEDLGAAMQPVIAVFDERVVWQAAGHDAILFLGEVDHPTARDRLMRELETPQDDAALDAVVHALARQGDPRARGRIAALGDEAVRTKSGNATPEQARRLGEVAFYHLTLGAETMAEGLAMLGTIALRDQQWTAAWAVHTLCARAVRHPANRDAIESHRKALIDELDRRGISWQDAKGPIACGPAGP